MRGTKARGMVVTLLSVPLCRVQAVWPVRGFRTGRYSGLVGSHCCRGMLVWVEVVPGSFVRGVGACGRLIGT
jgi:hypothetical protein